MGKRAKYVCLDCHRIFNRKRNVVLQKCPDCGSTNSQRAGSSSAGKPTPPDLLPIVPSIPKPPPAPSLATGSALGSLGGAIAPAITGRLLNDQLGKLKKVVKVAAVPGGVAPAESSIPWGIRVIASQVEVTVIRRARFAVPVKTRSVDALFYTAPITVNVGFALGHIANGNSNSANHGNFNTEYRNRGRDLPTGRRCVSGARRLVGSWIRYQEYGWKRTMPPATRWFKRTARGASAYAGASLAEQREIDYYLSAPFRNFRLNCERLIVAETGEVFYTADHYETFFRYSAKTKEWYYYKSAEALKLGADWDESFYD